MKLHPLSGALTFGLLWGLGFALMTCVAAYNGYAAHILEMIEGVYPFYAVSMTGALWGLLWGFLDAFIGAYLIIWIYNFFVKKLAKK
jgi:hypothetical protein